MFWAIKRISHFLKCAQRLIPRGLCRSKRDHIRKQQAFIFVRLDVRQKTVSMAANMLNHHVMQSLLKKGNTLMHIRQFFAVLKPRKIRVQSI